jgi:hypothetical protein
LETGNSESKQSSNEQSSNAAKYAAVVSRVVGGVIVAAMPASGKWTPMPVKNSCKNPGESVTTTKTAIRQFIADDGFHSTFTERPARKLCAGRISGSLT